MVMKPNIWYHIRSVLLLIGLIAIVSASPIAPLSDNNEVAVVVLDTTNKTQSVIRLNPLDLPSLTYDASNDMDSTLFKIQSLLPPHRNYVNSKRMRQSRPLYKQPETNVKIINDLHDNQQPLLKSKNIMKFQKPKQRKKQLHFLYSQEDFDGNHLMKRLPVRFVSGAYPVYYVRSGVNGKFGKFPIKGFRNEADFDKYLLKSKLEPIELAQRYET